MKELTHALFRLILKASLLIAIGWGLWTYFVPDKHGESDSAPQAKPVVDPAVVEQRQLDKALAEQAEAAKAAAEPESKPGEEHYARGELMAYGPLKRNAGGEWIKNGVWSNYWANGTLNTCGEYQNGEQVGNWPFWSDSGQFIITNEFKAPVLIAATVSPPPAIQQPQNVAPEVKTGEVAPEQGVVTVPEQTAVAEKPSLPPALTALKKKADDTLARGKSKEAYGLYEKMEKNQGLDADMSAYVQLQKGICRLRENRAADAFKIWEQMRRQYSQTAYAPTSLSMEAGWPGNKTKVDQLTDEILATYPASSEAEAVYVQRAEAAVEKKDFQQAGKWMEAYRTNFPQKMQDEGIAKRCDLIVQAANGDVRSCSELEAGVLVRQANALFDKASFPPAQHLYEQVIQKYANTSQGGLASGKLAQCFQAQGKDREAFDVIQRMADRKPIGAELGLSEIVIHAANTKGADALRQKATQFLLDKYPNTFEAQQALFVAGTMAMSKKNRAEAQKSWEILLIKYPETQFRTTVEKELGLVQEEKPKPKLTHQQELLATKQRQDDELKELAERRKILEREASEFESGYRNFEAQPERRAECAYQWGERCFGLEQYEKAAQQYQRVWEEFPESMRTAQAAFRAAQAWFCANQPKKGEEQSLFLINRYPKSDLRPCALWALGNRKILYEGNLKDAWQYYEQLLNEYPDHECAIIAKETWARVSKLSKEDLKQQVEHFIKTEQAALKKHT